MGTRIKLLQDWTVYPNGYTRDVWPKGAVREVSDSLLKSAIDLGVCEIIEDKSLTPELETGAVVDVEPKKRKPGRPRKNAQ